MTMYGQGLHGVVLAEVPAPSVPLGSFEDGIVAWAGLVTLMGFVGVVALALAVAGPAASRIGTPAAVAVTSRLGRVAAGSGLLAIPAVLTGAAHRGAPSGGYDYGAAWAALYDGSTPGLLGGLEATLILAGLLLVVPLAIRPVGVSAQLRTWLLSGALVAGAVALATTKFPSKAPQPGTMDRTIFTTVMWVMHLWGGSVWIGGLIGLLALFVRGAVPAEPRAAFWSTMIRRFSVSAMSGVTAIVLSGLFLYWSHVDSLDQLLTTTYGRVLLVKILLFCALLLLGAVNQFWLHPRVEALRAAGDTRPLRVILARQFPVTVTVEVLLGLTVLLVAPFLHGSARNEAYQAQAAKVAPAGTRSNHLPKAPPKLVTASTWAYGAVDTLIVVGVMAGAYRASGRVIRRRTGNEPKRGASPADLVDA